MVWRGEHLLLGTDLDLDNWCPGNLPRLDRYVGSLKQLFEAPDDLLVRYFLFPPPISALNLCSEPSRACTIQREELVGGLSFTDILPDRHEVVHAVLRYGDHIPQFLEEGAATYWGGTQLDGSPFYYDVDIEEMFAASWSRRLTAEDYGRAAHFTAYLVDQFGAPDYVELLHHARGIGSPEAFEPVFAEVFGLSLADTFADYREWEYCNLRNMRSTFFDCAQGEPVVVTADAPVRFEFDLSCRDPEVQGPQINVKGQNRLWRDVVVELGPRDDRWNVDFDLPAPGTPSTLSIHVRPCGTDCGAVMAEGKDFITEGILREQPSFSMAPGRYIMRISRSVDETGPVRFLWR